MIIKQAHERAQILTAHNASVAQTSVGVEYFSFMKTLEMHNVRYRITTSTFAHAQTSLKCAFHSLVGFLSTRLRSTLQSFTKQRNTEYVIIGSAQMCL